MIRYLSQLGPTLGAAIVGNSVLSVSLPTTTAARLTLAGTLQAGFLVVLVLSVITLVIAFFLKDVPMTQQASEASEQASAEEQSSSL